MASTVANPLEQLPLDQLRQRTSMKWRTHPDGVLPLWVAEMDVPLAAPVHQALTDALARGDTGYPSGPRTPRPSLASRPSGGAGTASLSSGPRSWRT